MTFSCRLIVLLALLPLANCILRLTCMTPSTDNNLPISINLALIPVASNALGTGFAEFRNPAGVNALGRCTGAHSGVTCEDCLANAAGTLGKNCANYQDGVAWYNSCILRFSTENFFGNWNVRSIYGILPSTENSQSPLFQGAASRLAETVSNMAVQSGPKLFAAKHHHVQEIYGVTIYAMAQCTQDLPTSQCQECLNFLRSEIRSNCGNADGCTLLHTSCILRYGSGMFFT